MKVCYELSREKKESANVARIPRLSEIVPHNQSNATKGMGAGPHANPTAATSAAGHRWSDARLRQWSPQLRRQQHVTSR